MRNAGSTRGQPRSSGKRTNTGVSKRPPPLQNAKEGSSPFVLLIFLCLIVVSATVLAHWPVLSAQAVAFDDGQYLTENPLVQHPSWASAGRFLREISRPSTVEGYYQPLAMISLMLDYAVAGSPDNLRPFHRTSLILHTANTVLVIVLLYVLFGRPWAAAAVGLLFGAHPMTVETVAWVGERKTLLAAFFALWCLIVYLRYTRRPAWRPYVTCLVLYVLAVLSKPTSIPLPVVLLLLDFWPLGRLSKRTIIEKTPFLLIAGASSIITIVSQGHIELSAFRELSAGQTLLLVFHNLVFYPCHMVWPAHLSSFYAFPEDISLSNAFLLTCVMASVLVLVLLLISLRWTRALLAGWLCFVVLLSPTLFNKSYSPSVAWDKYAYLPAVGLLLILAWLLQRIGSRGADAQRKVYLAVMVAVVIVVAGVLATGSRRYLGHWQTTEGLCNYMLNLTPNAAPLYNHRGVAYARKHDYEHAIQDCTRAIDLLPSYAEPHYNRGLAYAHKSDYSSAVGDFNKAIELKPDFAEACHNRGNAYAGLGDYDRAIQDYSRAIEMKPDFAEAYNHRAVAHGNLGDFTQAIRDYTKAVELRHDYAEAYHNRGNACAGLRDYNRAIQDYSQAIEVKPDLAEAYSDRGNAYNGVQDYDRAIRDCTRAIELKPDLAEAYNNRAVAHGNLQDFTQAIRDCAKAVELKPDYAEAHNNLGNAHLALRDHGRAILDYDRAIQLKPDYAKAYGNRGIAYYSAGEYGRAWADVEKCRQLGGEVSPELITALTPASSRPE